MNIKEIEYQKRRDLISDRLGKFFPSSLVNPKGAFYHFISCKPFLGLITRNGRLIESDTDFCEFLLEDFGALMGLVCAFICVLIADTTGNAVWDGIGIRSCGLVIWEIGFQFES